MKRHDIPNEVYKIESLLFPERRTWSILHLPSCNLYPEKKQSHPSPDKCLSMKALYSGNPYQAAPISFFAIITAALALLVYASAPIECAKASLIGAPPTITFTFPYNPAVFKSSTTTFI